MLRLGLVAILLAACGDDPCQGVAGKCIGVAAGAEHALIVDTVDVLDPGAPAPEVRVASIEGLAGLGARPVLPKIVSLLKDEHPGLDGHSPQLSSLVNELEVMTVTEKIKFNRGDYL